MRAGFCTYCKRRTQWKRVEYGWIFHYQLPHDRCAVCGRVVGQVALETLAGVKRAFHPKGIDREIALARHAVMLDTLYDLGDDVQWSDPPEPKTRKPEAPAPAPVQNAPTRPVRRARVRTRPGPGFRPGRRGR